MDFLQPDHHLEDVWSGTVPKMASKGNLRGVRVTLQVRSRQCLQVMRLDAFSWTPQWKVMLANQKLSISSKSSLQSLQMALKADAAKKNAILSGSQSKYDLTRHLCCF